MSEKAARGAGEASSRAPSPAIAVHARISAFTKTATSRTGTGEKLREITLTGAGPQGIVPYRNDATLFLALSRQGKVLAIDSATLETLREYATGAGPDGMGYSPLTLR